MPLSTQKINRCYWNASGGGTGNFVYASTISGFLSPSEADPDIVSGKGYHYIAENGTSEWEVGYGEWNVGGSYLSRMFVYNSSNSNSNVNFSSAPKVRLGVILAEDFDKPLDITLVGSPYFLPDVSYVRLTTNGSGTANVIKLASANLDSTSFNRKLIIILNTISAPGDTVTCSDADISFSLGYTGAFVELEWNPYYYQWVVMGSSGVNTNATTNGIWFRGPGGDASWVTPLFIYNNVTTTPNQFIMSTSDTGQVFFQNLDPNFQFAYESQTTNGATTLNVTPSFHQQRFTSSGSAGNENVSLNTPSGLVFGARFILKFQTRTNASDRINFTNAFKKLDGSSPTTVKLNNQGDMILVEWQAQGWTLITWSAGTVT
jgi:hypothetical protein